MNSFWQQACGTIDDKFDFILSSHMLYYIPPEDVDVFIDSLIDKLKDGGNLAIVLNARETSREGNFYFDFFSRFGDLKKAKLDTLVIERRLKDKGYNVKRKRIYPYVATISFGDFQKIGYFLLLEPEEKLRRDRHDIDRYLQEHCFSKSKYTLYLPQDIIVVEK